VSNISSARQAGSRKRRTAALVTGVALLAGGVLTAVPASSATTAPAGFRLVGLGHVAIAVPEVWGSNDAKCTTPFRDTVIIDTGFNEACLITRNPGIESVTLSSGPADYGFTADDTFALGGVTAQRERTTCSDTGTNGSPVCTGAVRFPSLQANFRAASSTDAAAVEAILSRIRFVSDRVAVPDDGVVFNDEQENSGQVYVDRLQALGLAPRVAVRQSSGMDAGYLLDVSPPAGTLLEPGDTVTVAISAAPRGPGDEFGVAMNSDDDAVPDGLLLTDEQVRAGTTVTIPVGRRIWASTYPVGTAIGDGKDHGEGTLGGELNGTSLRLDDRNDGRDYGPSWLAARPGPTDITLTITADGQRIVLGVVHVIVSGG